MAANTGRLSALAVMNSPTVEPVPREKEPTHPCLQRKARALKS